MRIEGPRGTVVRSQMWENGNLMLAVRPPGGDDRAVVFVTVPPETLARWSRKAKARTRALSPLGFPAYPESHHAREDER